MASKRPPNLVERTPSGVVIEFWDSVGVDGERQQRRYRCNGERYVNASTVVDVLAKEALLGWVERLTREGKDWREEREAAADRGHNSHDLILRYLMGKRVSLRDLPDEGRAWGQAAFNWLNDRGPKVERAEFMVACPTHRYAGRPDLLAEIDGVWTLADYKTLTRWSYKRVKGVETDERHPPYDENLIQLDLYQGALIESGYEPAQRGLIVRLGPDGTYDETFVDLDPDRGVALVNAYRVKLAAGKVLRDAYKATQTQAEVEGQIAEAVAAVSP